MSIPEACGNWKTTKGAYRFFTNNSVNADKILQAHYLQTCQKISETNDAILVAQDTTDIDYTTHTSTKGLGYLQGERLFGIKIHSGLAITQNGTPLGLLSQTRWIRNINEFGKRRMKGKEKRPMEAKESNRWLTTVREVEMRIPKNKEAIVIGDRESDLYELFALKRKHNIHLLVRAKYNRYLWGVQKRLFTKISSTEKKDTLTISVQKTLQRHIRKVELSIRFTNVTLASKYGHGAIRLWALEAKEEKPPQGVKPIHWILLTTVPVKTIDKAKTIIDWYTKRWLIERFHYTLKSGCKIEQLQLRDKKRLERAISVFEIVAWRLLWITHESREHPDENYRKILTEKEWHILSSINKKDRPETIQEGILMIARLGGFLARKGDRNPGVKVLWIGIRRLTDIMQGWQLAKDEA